MDSKTKPCVPVDLTVPPRWCLVPFISVDIAAVNSRYTLSGPECTCLMKSILNCSVLLSLLMLFEAAVSSLENISMPSLVTCPFIHLESDAPSDTGLFCEVSDVHCSLLNCSHSSPLLFLPCCSFSSPSLFLLFSFHRFLAAFARCSVVQSKPASFWKLQNPALFSPSGLAAYRYHTQI